MKKFKFSLKFDKKFTIKVIAEGVSTAVVDDPTVAECAKQFK